MKSCLKHSKASNSTKRRVEQILNRTGRYKPAALARREAIRSNGR